MGPFKVIDTFPDEQDWAHSLLSATFLMSEWAHSQSLTVFFVGRNGPIQSDRHFSCERAQKRVRKFRGAERGIVLGRRL